jgi:hypothetical protein
MSTWRTYPVRFVVVIFFCAGLAALAVQIAFKSGLGFFTHSKALATAPTCAVDPAAQEKGSVLFIGCGGFF